MRGAGEGALQVQTFPNARFSLAKNRTGPSGSTLRTLGRSPPDGCRSPAPVRIAADIILPRERVADNDRLLAHDAFGATVAVLEGAAELVNRGIRVYPHGVRILPDVGARVDAGGPS